MKKFILILLWVLFGSLSIAIGFYPLNYLLAEKPILVLRFKSAELLARNFYMMCFYLHIIFGGVVLLIGWLQFSKKLQRKYTQLHRWIGKCYILSVFISGIPGLYIAFYASYGLSPKLGFGMMAVLWLTFTTLGYLTIRKGDVAGHKKMMTYSYAATFAAVTFRLWLPLLMMVFGKFSTAYQIVPWLSWVPNLIIVYFVLERQKRLNHSF